MKYYTTKIDNNRPPKLLGMKHRLLCFILLFSIVTICTVGCDSYTYHTQARELIDSIKALLISEKLCSDKNDCRIKEYVLSESSTGVYISTYGINDQSIAKKITGLCIDAHAKNPGIQYELHMYPLTKREDLKSYKSKRAMLQLILHKEE